MMGGGFGLFGGGMFLGPILLVVLLYAVFWGFSGDRSRESSSDALETLRSRYARGEIDEEEFEAKRAMLERRR